MEVRGLATRSARDAPDTRGAWARGWFVVLAFLSASCDLFVFLTALWVLARDGESAVVDWSVFLGLAVAFSFVGFNPITPIRGVLARSTFRPAARTSPQGRPRASRIREARCQLGTGVPAGGGTGLVEVAKSY